ncbi:MULTISPECIES: hypothetical protein [Streptococcus]|jgi:putative membrane protein|uniref:Uncharacterized protein n=1 Tax=Streptococcus mitis TaxID=28037 RepID=A0A1X1JPH2_STRMT|nr:MULTISPECIES: hypothetical protein [Streptococcus]MDU2138552.1 hypothetical protein [Streptococcus mitis]ORO89034.1 hypothetical protein B7702_05160 [Streptococcus mitis]ORP02809.1 hypothetical protein B7693_04645 [Streptococcus mitis]RSJ97946.1 hypothetical protein D8786_04985 [Streptococcus mitis]
MKKRSIFSASFEESLNLEDDGFLQYQKGNVFSKLETYYREGKSKLVLHIQNIVFTLIGPVIINFMILVFSLSLHNSDPKDLRLPIYQHPLLTAEVYLVCFLIWVFIILIGKVFRKAFILPYRNHFHVITFLIWLSLEFNLLAIDMSLPTLSIWMVAAIFVFITILAYFMFSLEIENLKKLMYGNGSGSSLRNKIANKIAIYGMSFLGIGVIINFIIKSFSIKFSTSLEGLGLLITWIILNIAVIAMLIYIEFPSYLQAFYKWKYPEEYREWEGKTVEEWYGKKYLKKHKELLK